MGTACSTHGNDEKCIYTFRRKTMVRRGHSEHVGADGKIISERILGKLLGNCGLDSYGLG
jgi:hypothetical protein